MKTAHLILAIICLFLAWRFGIYDGMQVNTRHKCLTSCEAVIWDSACPSRCDDNFNE